MTAAASRPARLAYKLLNALETVLALPLSAVDIVDFEPPLTSLDDRSEVPWSSRPLLERKAFPNGVALDERRTLLAVAYTSRQRVDVYALEDPDSSSSIRDSLMLLHDRKPNASLQMPFAVDNLAFAPTSEGRDHETLVATGHANFPALLRLVRDSHAIAPSWVVAIEVNSTGQPVVGSNSAAQGDTAPVKIASRVSNSSGGVKTLFQSSGERFSSSTTGVILAGGDLLVTGLYASEGIIVCTA